MGGPGNSRRLPRSERDRWSSDVVGREGKSPLILAAMRRFPHVHLTRRPGASLPCLGQTKCGDGAPTITAFQGGTGWLKANQALLDCQGKVRKRSRERSKAPCSPRWEVKLTCGPLPERCVTSDGPPLLRFFFTGDPLSSSGHATGQVTHNASGRKRASGPMRAAIRHGPTG